MHSPHPPGSAPAAGVLNAVRELIIEPSTVNHLSGPRFICTAVSGSHIHGVEKPRCRRCQSVAVVEPCMQALGWQQPDDDDYSRRHF